MNQPAVSYPADLNDTEMKLTVAAAGKMTELMAEADKGLEGIRVFVSGGGCGGMEYGLTFIEEAQGYDSVLSGDGFNIYVDPVALNYLKGCEIDYKETGMGASFVFNNVFQEVGGSGVCGACGAAGGGCGG